MNTTTASPRSLADLLPAFGIDDQSLEYLTDIGGKLQPDLTKIVDQFYDWALYNPEIRIYFGSEQEVQQLKKQQVAAWAHLLREPASDKSHDLIKTIGRTHAAIGLRPLDYAVASARFLELFRDRASELGARPDQLQALDNFLRLKVALVIQEYSECSDEMVMAQSKAIMELATPVADLWDDILMLPVVGIIDSERAQQIMNTVLTKISELKSRVLILDISGVAVVDTAVAAHLVRFAKASLLMGCSCIVSGISPAIAQTIVELGVDVGDLATSGSLRDALTRGFQLTGRQVVDARQ